MSAALGHDGIGELSVAGRFPPAKAWLAARRSRRRSTSLNTVAGGAARTDDTTESRPLRQVT